MKLVIFKYKYPFSWIMEQNEVRVTLSSELKDKLYKNSKLLGIKPTEYVKSLIIEDVKKGGLK